VKAVAVVPGQPHSAHLADIPAPAVDGLDDWPEAFRLLAGAPDVIKVFVEVAPA
jgi:hypothetical protein